MMKGKKSNKGKLPILDTPKDSILPIYLDKFYTMGFNDVHTYNELYRLVKDGIDLPSEDEDLNEIEEEY
jgi:hypothetical protein